MPAIDAVEGDDLERLKRSIEADTGPRKLERPKGGRFTRQKNIDKRPAKAGADSEILWWKRND